MRKKHAKSPCCREKAIHFGAHRRQCTRCRQTWRVRPKRRGRKRKRSGADLASRYLTHSIPPVSTSARSLGQSVSTAKHRLARSLRLFLKTTPWPAVPAAVPLVAVADAWIKKPRGSYHTWYGIFLRPVAGNRAAIMPLSIVQAASP